MSEDKNTEEIIEKSEESYKKVETSIEDLEKKIETLEKENDVLKDKLLRLQADFENQKKQDEKTNAQKILKNKLYVLSDFMTIYEDFIRAENSLSKNKVDTSGIEVIIKNMEKIFSENNISQIDTIGKPFDPQIHEAVSVTEDDSVDDGIIIQEVAKGYYAEKRILKPSKVIVSKKKSEK